MTTDKQLATRSDPGLGALKTYLRSRERALASYAASRVRPETLIRLALLEFSQSEWLRRCTPESIYGALITAAQLGLDIGAAKGEAYLVPYKGRCQLVPGYRGLIRLALRSKHVRAIYAHVVYDADDFAIELGSDPRVVHRPAIDGDRGAPRGAYAVAQLATGLVDVEWCSIAELEAVRAEAARNRGGKDSVPWAEHTSEMYRKTAIRRIAKRLPLGDEAAAAVHLSERVDAGHEAPIDLDLAPADGEIVEPAAARDSVRDRVRAAAAATEPT